MVWFHESATVDGYGEAEVKAFLNLETVAELADATLYRMPAPGDFGARAGMSEFLGSGSAIAARWASPSGMHDHFRDAPFYSLVLTNRLSSLPDMDVVLPRFAEIWGLDFWPRWGWRFPPVIATLVNLAGVLALVVMPLWFWFGRRRRIEAVFVVLPALYMHGVYAVALGLQSSLRTAGGTVADPGRLVACLPGGIFLARLVRTPTERAATFLDKAMNRLRHRLV